MYCPLSKCQSTIVKRYPKSILKLKKSISDKNPGTHFTLKILASQVWILCCFAVDCNCLRPGQTRKHCCGSKNASRTQKNVFGKFQKHFLLPRRRFCAFNICCVGEQTRNHLGNTEETLILNVSRMFPR